MGPDADNSMGIHYISYPGYVAHSRHSQRSVIDIGSRIVVPEQAEKMHKDMIGRVLSCR